MFKKIGRLLYLYAKMDLLWLLRDTKSSILVIVSDLIGTFAGLSGIILLSVKFNGIGGMSSNQVLFMLGYATCIDGVFSLFFGMVNTGYISRVIGRGQLDHMLIQPVPLPVQLATSGFIPFTCNSLLLCGLGLLGWSAAKLGMWDNTTWIPWFFVNLFSSVLVILAVSYIAGSSAFYAPVAAEEISSSAISFFSEIKRFPIGGLTQPMQIVLCTVLPAGLVAWFPASTILHLSTAGLPVYFLILFSLFISTIAAFIFKRGLKYYAKYGSVRYSDHGHRR